MVGGAELATFIVPGMPPIPVDGLAGCQALGFGA